MAAWLWVLVAAIGAIIVFALIWWSSGRARSRTISADRGTAEQRFQRDANRIASSRNRDGMGGGIGPLP